MRKSKKPTVPDKYYQALMELHSKFPDIESFSIAIHGETVAACSYNCADSRNPVEPLTALLTTENGLFLLMEALAGVPRFTARQIYERIGDMLGLNYEEDMVDEDEEDGDEEDMDGEEWKHSTANELCGTCVHFHETKCGFGKCKHHKGTFDGTQSTAQVTGQVGGCEHYEEKNGYEIQ